MKSSPKSDETPPSTGSKTPATGRKLVQARLPFKTLSGSEPPVTPSNDTASAATAAANATVATPILTKGITTEKRKRKQNTSLTHEDGVRAPKINRLQVNVDAGDDVVLISSETMEASCDLNVSGMNGDQESIGEHSNRSSESKENICLENNAGNESIVIESDDEIVSSSDDTKKTPKAKQSLSFVEPKSELRKSKRISDANIVKIKLPMTKKAKEAAKKLKKQRKSESNEDKSESSSDDKMDTDEPSTSSKDQSALNDSAFEANDDFDKSKLNDSIMSNVSLGDEPHTPTNQNLTPKQLQRKVESEKKALERQRAKVERERKLQDEKMMKQKEREEKEEQKRREKEERERKIQDEKEQKQREKEERERKIQEEKEQKLRKIQEEKEQKLREKEEKKKEREEKERKLQEEKEQKKKEREEKERKLQEEKEEKLRKKEEEKKKMEEEKEAEQRKNRKTSALFVKFFVPKKTDGKAVDDGNEENDGADQTPKNFMSFQVKEGMKMAPVMRRMLNADDRTTLEQIISSDANAVDNYLSELKSNKIVPRKFGRTLQDDEDEKCSNEDDVFVIDDSNQGIQVIEEKPKKIYRAKFFKFTENQRPPYYGTWRKKSNLLGPRKPFAQDSTFFNYEIDSDDEWEEEEPGESLHGSDDEKDRESEDDYDIDNEFFVPHGHLSDEELQNEDDIDYENNPEDHKVKMQLIQKQFDKEMKKKTQKLKPRVIGLIWQNADGTQPDNCSNGVWNLLNANTVLCDGICVKIEPPSAVNESLSDDENSNNKSVRRLKISEKEVPDLIRLINGNTYKIDFLTEEFRAFIAKNNPGQREYTTASIKNKIRELAIYQRCPEDGAMHNKKCWYVPIATRKRFDLNDLSFPNEWSYTIPPRRPIQSADLETQQPENQEKKPHSQDIFDIGDDSNSCGLSETLTPETIKQAAMKPNSYNIAKFIRVLSEEEKKKQFDPIVIRGPTIDLTIDAPSTSADNKNARKKRNSNATASAVPPKKRVNLLMSVPRGQDFSPKTKNSLVTQFLTNDSKKPHLNDANDNKSTDDISIKTAGKKKKSIESVIVIDE